MSPARLGGLVIVVCGLEAAAVAAAGPSGAKLRLLVDLWTWEALALGLAGAFLMADRPFLAAREIARRLKGETGARPGREPATRPRADRSFGAVTLGLGAALFAAASLAWKLGGG